MPILTEFKQFLLKQNVVALAIAVVVGTALNTLVKAVVDDFIMPLITYFEPGGAWKTATWDVGPFHLGVGDFLAALLNFLIVGLVAWRISRIFIKPDIETPKKNCPYCKMPMDASATRCPHCTSQLAAA